MEVILTPLAMRIPNSEGVYAPSKFRDPKILSVDDFRKYSGLPIRVSFEADCISNPQIMTAYGYGLDCWYLAEFENTGK